MSCASTDRADIHALTHRRGEAPCGGLQESHQFQPPVHPRRIPRPQVDFQQVENSLAQETVDGVELRNSHVRNFLDNVLPIHTVDPLPARDTAQQVGLMFRPAQDIAVIEFGCHDCHHSTSMTAASSRPRSPGQHRLMCQHVPPEKPSGVEAGHQALDGLRRVRPGTRVVRVVVDPFATKWHRRPTKVRFPVTVNTRPFPMVARSECAGPTRAPAPRFQQSACRLLWFRRRRAGCRPSNCGA